MSSEMHRTQIYLTKPQYIFLHDQAEKCQISMAEVIREIINEYLPKATDYADNPLFNIHKKKLVMKKKEASVKHDKYIYGTYEDK